MSSLRSILDGATAERMDVASYYRDFDQEFWKCREFWKLESAQSFAEPGNASWEAFSRGDWDQALALLAAGQEDLLQYHRELSRNGTVARRVRIIEFPISPYLQWELHALKLRDEAGGPIRVLDASTVMETGKSGLPELYTMDDRVAYEAIYDEAGVLEWALKYEDPELVRECKKHIVGLYDQATEIKDFFLTHVAKLPPPIPDLVVESDYLERNQRPKPIRS